MNPGEWKARIWASKQRDGSYRWSWEIPTGSTGSGPLRPSGALVGNTRTHRLAVLVVDRLLRGRVSS